MQNSISDNFRVEYTDIYSIVFSNYLLHEYIGCTTQTGEPIFMHKKPFGERRCLFSIRKKTIIDSTSL